MSKKDWSMSQWRDYYETLQRKAYTNYQETGMSRYDREQLKYDIIVHAFDGYLANKSESDDAKIRRQHNIDALVERQLDKSEYTREEVMTLVRQIRDF